MELVECVASTGLAPREHRRRHDWMGLRVYWEPYQKYGVRCADVWYKEVSVVVRVSEDRIVEILWDRSVEATQRWNVIVQMLLW